MSLKIATTNKFNFNHILLALIFLVGISCSPSNNTAKSDHQPANFDHPESFDESEYYNSKKVAEAADFRVNFKQAKVNGGRRAMFQHVEYPENARENGITGVVISKVFLNEAGEIDNIVITKTPSPILSHAAMKAILQTSFIPASLDGEPVKSIYEAPILFRLNKERINY